MMMAMHRPVASSECAVCENEFRKDDRIVSCPDCDTPFHVRCAAQTFLRSQCQKRSTCLVPSEPTACPHCGKTTDWPMLVRSARRFEASSACEADLDESHAVHAAPSSCRDSPASQE